MRGLEADLVTRARHRHLAVDVEGQAGPVERAGDGAKRASVTVVEHDWKVLAGSHTAPSIGLRTAVSSDQIDPANVSHARVAGCGSRCVNHFWRCAEEPCVNDSGFDLALRRLLDAVVADRRRGVEAVGDVGVGELVDERRSATACAAQTPA